MNNSIADRLDKAVELWHKDVERIGQEAGLKHVFYNCEQCGDEVIDVAIMLHLPNVPESWFVDPFKSEDICCDCCKAGVRIDFTKFLERTHVVWEYMPPDEK